MPAGGVNGGVGGIQPGLQNTGLQEQQPAKAKWGSRKLFGFSPKKLFMSMQNAVKSLSQQNFKTLQQFNIQTAQPKIHIQVGAQGSTITQTHTLYESRTSKASLKQQAAILIDKGLTATEAQKTIKKLNKNSGGSQLAVEEGVGKISYRDKQRQAWSQWAEQSFMEKGYSPQEARKWSQDLMKRAGSYFKTVEQVVRNTPMTPLMKVAVEHARQAEHQQAVNKANDFNWGVGHFTRLGHSPEVARDSIAKAQQHFGDNRAGFHQWVQNAPAVQPKAAPQTDQAKLHYIENSLKPWMIEHIKSKGFELEDAVQLADNLVNSANGNIELMISSARDIQPAYQSQPDASIEESLKKDAESLKALELDESADLTAIKKAFRNLSRKYHPDKNPDPGAQDKFLEINDAHEHLTSKSTTFKRDS